MNLPEDDAILPLDDDTLARLERFARGIGKPVGEAAALLLRDLLDDDDFWDEAEGGEVESPPTALN